MMKTSRFPLILVLSVFTLLFLHSQLSFGETGSETKADRFDIALTPLESAWLKNHQTIRIAGPRSFPPFHYYDEDGSLKGMSADYIKIIMNSLGIAVEIQHDLPWTEVLKKAQAKEIDVIPCSAKTIDREAYLNFSAPYLSFPLVIISTKEGPFIGGLEDLHGKTVALTKGISTIEWLQRDNIRIVPYPVDSVPKALEATSFGQADATIENLAAASYLIQKNGLTNLKIAAPTPYGNYNLYIAVRNDWPELVGIINKSLAAIPPEAHSSIRNKWLSVRYEHGIRGLDVLKWVFGVTTISALILVIILIWNRRLKQEIAERKKAEEKRAETIVKLEDALDNIKALSGLLPICASCKKIRDDEGYWKQMEQYIEEHSDAQFSHSVCPECADKLYGKYEWFQKGKKTRSEKI